MLIASICPLGDCWLQPERQVAALLMCRGCLHPACLLCLARRVHSTSDHHTQLTNGCMPQPPCPCHPAFRSLHLLGPHIARLRKASVLQASAQRDCGVEPEFLPRSYPMCTHTPSQCCRWSLPTCVMHAWPTTGIPTASGTSWSAAARLATQCSCCARLPPRQPSQAPLASLRQHSLLSWMPRARPTGGQVRTCTPA